MIPILEGGALPSAGAGSAAPAARGGADTAGGSSFEQIFSAQGAGGQGVDNSAPGKQPVVAAGKVLQAGGKNLPPGTAADTAGAAVTATEQPLTALLAALDAAALAGENPAPANGEPGTAAIADSAGLSVALSAGQQQTTPALAVDLVDAETVLPAAPGPRGEQPTAAGIATPLTAAAQTAAAPVTTNPLSAPRALTPAGDRPLLAAQLRGSAQSSAGTESLPLLPADSVETGLPSARIAPQPEPRVAAANDRPLLAVADESAVRQRAEALIDALPAARIAPDSAGPAAATDPGRAPTPLPVGQTGAPAISGLAPPVTDSASQSVLQVDVTGTLAARTGEPGWNRELAGRISMMFRNGSPEASLQLNPPDLGRMDIKISTDGDQARILFSVQGAETRDIVEQALPRLRELLGESGLALSRFDVSDHSQPQRDGGGNTPASAGLAAAEHEEVSEAPGRTYAAHNPRSLVDYYV